MKSAHRSLTGTGAGTSPATTPKTTIAGRSLLIVDVRMCIRAGGAVFNGVVPYLEVRTGNQLALFFARKKATCIAVARLFVATRTPSPERHRGSEPRQPTSRGFFLRLQ
jgi:hypothetical protein